MGKPKAFYKKGTLWGRDGYEIAVGLTDYRFYFGTLKAAKAAACARFCTTPSRLEWVNMGV